MKSLFLILFLKALLASALTPQEQICGNSNPCQVDSVNFNIVDRFSLSSVVNQDQTQNHGNYGTIVAWSPASKKNFIVFANNPLLCTGSFGFIFELNGDDTPLSKVEFIQNTANSCVLSFSQKISFSDLQKQLNIVFAIGQGISSQTAVLNVQMTDDISHGTLPIHWMTLQPWPVIFNGVKYTLNFQSLTNAMVNPSCDITNAQTFENTKLYFVDSMFQPNNPAACQFSPNSVVQVSSAPNTWRVEWIIGQIPYWGCSKTFKYFFQNYDFTMESKLIIPNCDYYENYPNFNSLIEIEPVNTALGFVVKTTP